jgi:hypothetical protein
VGHGGGVESVVIINEVAWSGTQASPEHEWIELANVDGPTVDLKGWTLAWRERRTHDQPIEVITSLADFRRLSTNDEPWEVSLRGFIEPDSYYLLERYTDEVVDDLDADLLYAVISPYTPEVYRLLDAPGEEVYLFDAKGSLVSSANTDYGRTEAGAARYQSDIAWPGGRGDDFASMERVLENRLLTVQELDMDVEWDTNEGILINGLDATLDPLTATARAANEDESTIESPAMQLGAVTIRRGEALTFTILLQSEGIESGNLPRVTLLAGTLATGMWVGTVDPTGGEGVFASGEQTIVGAGGEWSLSGQPAIVEITRGAAGDSALPWWASIEVRTDALAPGQYTLCITQGNELVYIVELSVMTE